jgi:hypothetical protein
MDSEVYKVIDIQKKLNIFKNVAYELIKQEGFPVIKKILIEFPRRTLKNGLISQIQFN